MSTAEITILILNEPEEYGLELKGKYKTYNYEYDDLSVSWGDDDDDIHIITFNVHSPPPRARNKYHRHHHTLHIKFNIKTSKVINIWEWIHIKNKVSTHNELAINNNDIKFRIVNETPNSHIGFSEEPVDEDPQ